MSQLQEPLRLLSPQFFELGLENRSLFELLLDQLLTFVRLAFALGISFVLKNDICRAVMVSASMRDHTQCA